MIAWTLVRDGPADGYELLEAASTVEELGEFLLSAIAREVASTPSGQLPEGSLVLLWRLDE